MNEFFVVVPPGWEEELERELREFEAFLIGSDGRAHPEGFGEIRIEAGGISLRCEALLALQILFYSKLASRVLLRVAKFKTTEFSILEKSLRAVDLRKWRGEGSVRLKIEAAKSKLNNEKRILETATRVWGDRIQESASQTLLIRAFEDRFTVSLDLAGEHLHRRHSGRELGGPAPLRETLAALLLRFLIHGAPLSVLQQVELIDPMAGSGTLLSEAAFLYRPLRERAFAFQDQAWIPKLLQSPAFFANYRHIPERIWWGLRATDVFPEAKERLEALAHKLPEKLALAGQSGNQRKWVIANPPYGERLKALAVKELVQSLLQSAPERVAVILPKPMALDLARAWPAGWLHEKMPVSNGGIPCFLLRLVKNGEQAAPLKQESL